MRAILGTVVAATLTVGHAVHAQDVAGMSGMTTYAGTSYATVFSPPATGILNIADLAIYVLDT